MQRLKRKQLTLCTLLKRLTRGKSYFSKKQFFHDGLVTLFIQGLKKQTKSERLLME